MKIYNSGRFRVTRKKLGIVRTVYFLPKTRLLKRIIVEQLSVLHQNWDLDHSNE